VGEGEFFCRGRKLGRGARTGARSCGIRRTSGHASMAQCRLPRQHHTCYHVPVNLPSIDLLTLFFKLLPGFLAAAVFHALTPYPKRDILDRIVAALIFTMFAQICIAVVRSLLYWLGANVFSFGGWSPTADLVWGAIFGLALGLLWSHAINNGHTHEWLRKRGTTRRTSLPSQWFSALAKNECFIILHFKDERRLMGWPREWPDEPETGHFLMESPSWVLPDGDEAIMLQLQAILVSAKEVEAIEFLRFKDDKIIANCADAIQLSKSVLINTRKESSNEQQSKSANTPADGAPRYESSSEQTPATS